MNNTENLREIQSTAFDILRFPMSLLVVYAHMSPATVAPMEADFDMLSLKGVYDIVAIVVSHMLAHSTMPVFFLMAGYLFFTRLQQFSWDIYRQKLRSRVQTLLIPFLTWNAGSFVVMVISQLIHDLRRGEGAAAVLALVQEKGLHVFTDYYVWGMSQTNWLGTPLRWEGPFVFPLWFLRDLMVMCLLAPVIYYAVRKLRAWLLAVLLLAYISKIWTTFPGLNISSVFYFSAGAYFSINGYNVVQVAQRWKYLVLPLTAVTFVLATLYDGPFTKIGNLLHPLYLCPSVLATFYLTACYIRRYHPQPRKVLGGGSFVLYAMHTAYLPFLGLPVAFFSGLIHRWTPGTSVAEDFLVYLLTPLLTAALALLLYSLGKRFCPRLTALFSGNK